MHQNLLTYDTTTQMYGNKADVLVNNVDFSALNAAIFRSLFVIGSAGNDVEVGWTAHNLNATNPTLYIEWVDHGTNHGPFYHGGLVAGTTHNLKIQDANADGIYSAYIDTAYFAQTGTMNFTQGRVEVNTERNNTCDTAYSHFTNLKDCRTPSPCTYNTYSNLQLWRNDMADYYCNKIDDSQYFVQKGTATSCI